MLNFDEDDFEQDRMKEYQNRSMADEIIRRAYKKERTIYLYDDISSSNELIFIRMMEKLSEQDRGEKLPIHVKISSPGGDVLAGLAMVSAIESAKAKGLPVYTYAYSRIMSMAVPIFVSGTKRFTQVFSRYILHNPSTFLLGYMSNEQMNRTSREMKELLKIYKTIVLERTKISESELDNAFDRDDEYSFYGRDAISLGFADELF